MDSWTFSLQACLAAWGLALLIGPAGAAPPAGQLLVAATIVPLGDFCQQIGGDLVLVQDICRKIAGALIQADPGHQAQYEANLKGNAY